MKRIIVSLIGLLVVGVLGFFLIYGTPEQRMRTALVEAGLAEPVADCMAERLAEGLSYRQLWALSSLSIFRDREVADLTIGEFVDATRGLQDREVLLLAGRSGAVCALRSPRLEGLPIRR
ncbi:hypothetical protein HFP51_11875 [Parasphingopyxis sp. CP4]|uniref:hypothetical protein n=1 Tax=Parasphingopyxis sp. CP4 TaxID=2724527 RepID=UPI0015A3DACB|nr:hypothetical protein [Parasphingopyxis sp. CP4]QLC22816.1 hypothetical protein HFP51_11875 [Parasphingopyxis sp. CP4]